MSNRSFLKTFTKIFPLPKALSFDFIGVDMCRDSIKVMKLQDSKFGKIPIAYKEYLLKEECGLMRPEPEYKNCDEITVVLKKIKEDFKVDFANVSIPEVKTYIYKTKVPSNVGEKIHEALIFSVEENVPIKPEDVLLDYYVTKVDSEEVEVVVTVVQKNIIEMYTKVFESIGLKPISFEPETHAISRALVSKEDHTNYLLLNLDSCLSSIAVIDDAIVQYTQTLPVTSKDFAKDFNEDDAKTLKENINKVIIYWETSIANDNKEKIQTLFLVGEFSSSYDLLNYLEKNLSVNVKFANVWENSFNLDDYIPKLSARESLKYAASVGLALKTIK